MNHQIAGLQIVEEPFALSFAGSSFSVGSTATGQVGFGQDSNAAIGKDKPAFE
jgi:hypothetical protein